MPGPRAQFFTLEEAVAVEALAERIFPATEDGPGAGDAHVTAYIDGQLAGPWGQGDRMYREGPFLTAEDSGHGWQSQLTPSEAYRYALAAIERYASREHGRPVGELDDAELDGILQSLSEGTVDTFSEELSAKAFFSLFLENVSEGLFCDPIHGGNHDFVGWRWIGFPGDPDAYGEPYVTRFGLDEPYVVEPRGIRTE